MKIFLLSIITVLLFLNTLKAQFNHHLSFRDSNLVVDCGSMPDAFENVTQYTVEGRVKFKSFSWWATVLCKRTYFERDVVIQGYDTTGQLGIAVSGAGYGYTFGKITMDTWHHIAMVYDGNNATNGTRLKLYIDGVQQTLFFIGLVPPVTPAVPGSRLCLGAEYNDTTAVDSLSQLIVPFDGFMDEVRIWNTARTETEIISNMEAELTLPQTGLVAYYQFNQGRACDDNLADTILIDATGNNPGLLWNFEMNGSASNFASDVDNSITINGSLLSANAIGASYQWFHCDSDSIIIGENASSFNSPDQGSYAVIVTQNLCVDTSACYQTNLIGIPETENELMVNVYPNPLHGNELNFSGIKNDVTVTLINELGMIVDVLKLDEQNDVYDTRNLPGGIYFLRLEDSGSSIVKKLQIIR